MPAAWPVGLPAMSVAENWTEQPEDAQLRTEMEEGPAKVRRKANPQPATITFNQFLSAAETQTLDTFYVTTLSQGALTWDDTHPRTGASATYRFVGRPSYQHLHGNEFLASYRVEIVG